MTKSVKVHDDTHGALKALKERGRKRSVDQVIRELIEASTGSPVGSVRAASEAEALTKYLGI